jgi:BCCT, betaine/carnitine/choline family transporter
MLYLGYRRVEYWYVDNTPCAIPPAELMCRDRLTMPNQHYHWAADPTGSLETLLAGRAYVTLTFTWLLQGSKALLFFFLMYIVYRYGHIHLGRKGEGPEFNTRAYCSVPLLAGVVLYLGRHWCKPWVKLTSITADTFWPMIATSAITFLKKMSLSMGKQSLPTTYQGSRQFANLTRTRPALLRSISYIPISFQKALEADRFVFPLSFIKPDSFRHIPAEPTDQ